MDTLSPAHCHNKSMGTAFTAELTKRLKAPKVPELDSKYLFACFVLETTGFPCP